MMKQISPVTWTATEEDYDLTTANGRMLVNMKLTIAELEADQTGERINIVNEYKVSTDEKIYTRESLRLSLSLEKAHNALNDIPESQRGNLYVFMHYPPYNIHKNTLFTEQIEKYNVRACYYGHIDGISKKEIKRC